MRTALRIIAFALSLALCGCQKIIEPKDLPDQDPRLVLNSMVNIDSVFTARISLSKSIVSGKDYRAVEGAFVDVYEDGQYVEQLTMKSKGFYMGQKKPATGKRYRYVVRATGYNEVEAESTMPLLPSLKKAERYDTVNADLRNFGNGWFGSLSFHVVLTDDVNQKNFYGAKLMLLVTDDNGVHPVDQSAINLSPNYGLTVFSDESLQNGNECVADLNVYANLTKDVFPGVKKVEVYLQTAAVSEDYFRYQQTLSEQAYNSASYFSEPVQVYSNVKNGMGILGCINLDAPRLIYSRNL